MDPGRTQREEFTHVVDTYRDMVYRIAFNRTRSHHDADVTQDVFVKLWYHPEAWWMADSDHTRFWLIRVTIRECTSLFRRLARAPTVLADETTFMSDDPGPESELMGRERATTIRDAFLSLPASYRTVLQLYYELELSTPEIARALDMPQATIRTKLARGRRKLAALIEKTENEREAHDGRPDDKEAGHGGIRRNAGTA